MFGQYVMHFFTGGEGELCGFKSVMNCLDTMDILCPKDFSLAGYNDLVKSITFPKRCQL